MAPFRIPNNIPNNVDAILIPGCNGGILKIPNYADVTIIRFTPSGKPIIRTTYRSTVTPYLPGGTPVWFPAHRKAGNRWNKPIPGCPHQPKKKRRDEQKMGQDR